MVLHENKAQLRLTHRSVALGENQCVAGASRPPPSAQTSGMVHPQSQHSRELTEAKATRLHVFLHYVSVKTLRAVWSQCPKDPGKEEKKRARDTAHRPAQHTQSPGFDPQDWTELIRIPTGV